MYMNYISDKEISKKRIPFRKQLNPCFTQIQMLNLAQNNTSLASATIALPKSEKSCNELVRTNGRAFEKNILALHPKTHACSSKPTALNLATKTFTPSPPEFSGLSAALTQHKLPPEPPIQLLLTKLSALYTPYHLTGFIPYLRNEA